MRNEKKWEYFKSNKLSYAQFTNINSFLKEEINDSRQLIEKLKSEKLMLDKIRSNKQIILELFKIT